MISKYWDPTQSQSLNNEISHTLRSLLILGFTISNTNIKMVEMQNTNASFNLQKSKSVWKIQSQIICETVYDNCLDLVLNTN